jgi:hypothetical protein
MRNIRAEKIKDLERHLGRSSIKDHIVGLILRYVNSVVNMATITTDDETIAPELHHTIISQNKIGAVKMLQGYLSKAMEDYGEKHPNRRMTAILRGLWDMSSSSPFGKRGTTSSTTSQTDTMTHWINPMRRNSNGIMTTGLRSCPSTTVNLLNTPKRRYKQCGVKPRGNGYVS